MADQAREVCRDYRNTKNCRYGAECKYEHSEGEPIAQPAHVGECFAFRDGGNCKFDNKCRFAHGPSDSRIDAATGALTRDISQEVCRNYNRNLCRFGDECRRKHEGPVEPVDPNAAPAERRSRPRRPRGSGAPRETNGASPNGANNGANNGTASAAAGAGADGARRPRRPRRRGPKPAGAAAGQQQNQQNQQNQQPARAPRQRKPQTDGADAAPRQPRRSQRGPPIPNDLIVDEEGNEVCRNFYHRHQCRWSDQCRFIHVAGPNPIPDNAPAAPAQRAPREPRAPKQCRTFPEGTCTYGELCRFTHGENDQRDMAAVQAQNKAAREAKRAASAAAPAQQ